MYLGGMGGGFLGSLLRRRVSPRLRVVFQRQLCKYLSRQVRRPRPTSRQWHHTWACTRSTLQTDRQPAGVRVYVRPGTRAQKQKARPPAELLALQTYFKICRDVARWRGFCWRVRLRSGTRRGWWLFGTARMMSSIFLSCNQGRFPVQISYIRQPNAQMSLVLAAGAKLRRSGARYVMFVPVRVDRNSSTSVCTATSSSPAPVYPEFRRARRMA